MAEHIQPQYRLVTGAFIVNRRAAIFRVLLYLAITFTLGFAAGRVSAAPRPASNVIPTTSSGSVGESNLSGLTMALHSRFLLDVERSVPQKVTAPPKERRPIPSRHVGVGSLQFTTGLTLRGTATWYAANGLIAAVHSWRWGNRPYTVRVCASRCIRVLVQDYCAGCTGSRLIDLSDDAFRLLAPLWKGVIRVMVG